MEVTVTLPSRPAPLLFRGLSNLNVDVRDSPRNLDQPFRLRSLAFALRRLEMTNMVLDQPQQPNTYSSSLCLASPLRVLAGCLSGKERVPDQASRGPVEKCRHQVTEPKAHAPLEPEAHQPLAEAQKSQRFLKVKKIQRFCSCLGAFVAKRGFSSALLAHIERNIPM